MTQFKSSIGSKNVASRGNMRTFEVNDATDGQEQRSIDPNRPYSEQGFPVQQFPQDQSQLSPDEVKNPFAKQQFQNTAQTQSRSVPTQGQPIVRSWSAGQNFGPQEQQHSQDQVRNEEAAMARARQEKLQGGFITPEAKQRINVLLEFGRMTTEVFIGDIKYELRTLKSKENRDALQEASKSDSINQLFEVRKQQLARALFQIDGHDVSLIVGSTLLEARFELIDELDESVVSALYQAFANMNKASNDRFAIKTDEDVKEVVEDLKK